MLECRYCREWVKGDVETLGSRCPRCRMPLHERQQLPRRLDTGDSEKSCAVHAGVQAVGACERCQAPVCFTCRTRWCDQALCVRCVERALALGESPPESSSVQRRHAWLSLVASLAAWGLFLLGGLVLLTIYSAHPTAVLNLTGSVLLLSSFIIGLFALGQGTAGIRERGPRMRVATTGAVLAGVQIGVMVGFLFLNLWHN